MKRFLSVLVIGTLLLYGCSKQDIKTPTLTLSKSRIQVALNDEIDYLSYIETTPDDVESSYLREHIQYNKIDTSKTGKKEIHYTFKESSGHETTQTLIVDVVEYIDGELINPVTAQADIVDDPEDVTVLVNKLHEIPKGWVPHDLEKVIDCSQQLRKEANQAYTQFYQAAKSKGIAIYTISAYREPEKQELYWNNSVKVFGEEHAVKYNAYPRRSEHELGLCVDVSYTMNEDRLSEKVADSALGKFIESDAYRYGFILRYPKDKVKITGYQYEPWHIRYVGVELATQLHQNHLTLEEYYEN